VGEKKKEKRGPKFKKGGPFFVYYICNF